MIDADVDPSLVARDVIDAVGHGLAELLSMKSWTHTRGLRQAATPCPGWRSPDQLLLLGIYRDDRLAGRLEAAACALMCSNCALRSGCFEPSSALRLCWREKPKLHQLLAHGIGEKVERHCRQRLQRACPCSSTPRSRASWDRRGWQARRGRLSSGTSSGSVSATALAPATRAANLCPSPAAPRRDRSPPRLIVERASLVIRATTESPPHPAVRTSVLARSSLLPIVSSVILNGSPSAIMHPAYACSPKSGIIRKAD